MRSYRNRHECWLNMVDWWCVYLCNFSTHVILKQTNLCRIFFTSIVKNADTSVWFSFLKYEEQIRYWRNIVFMDSLCYTINTNGTNYRIWWTCISLIHQYMTQNIGLVAPLSCKEKMRIQPLIFLNRRSFVSSLSCTRCYSRQENGNFIERKTAKGFHKSLTKHYTRLAE